MLPEISPLRSLILTEPDTLSREVALAKMEVFHELLYQELGML